MSDEKIDLNNISQEEYYELYSDIIDSPETIYIAKCQQAGFCEYKNYSGGTRCAPC